MTVLEIYYICFVSILSLHRGFIKDNNLRTQPKFLVFLTQLLVLLKFCHSCKADNPLVQTKQVGTMAVITFTCTNKKRKSQPDMPGTKIPAGNFLSGSSASKVLQMFQHTGVACISLKTFFKHQSVGYKLHIIIIKPIIL